MRQIEASVAGGEAGRGGGSFTSNPKGALVDELDVLLVFFFFLAH